MSKKVLNCLLKVRFVFEELIPSITFVVMLFSFVLGVFCRYVLNAPLTWTAEVSQLTFAWTVLFGACYAMRMRGHVSFTMLYDIYPPKVKAWVGFISEAFIALTFLVAFVPTVNYVIFMGQMKTDVLQINKMYIYLPYLLFMIMNVFYLLLDAVRDLKAALNIGGAMEQLLHDTQAEWKTVIEEAEAAEAERLKTMGGDTK